ncbi:MAG: hypothetical protein A3C43_05965 [Candidatus Schekmanbacteria bacterium RIFCSPHIGHO2_02_FULL_38_11]|nr:MAG: hypothetical protein A3C43_05965 [Candidatus Schekmanbacteria bacterium RIFCSPHIGHO2_02_FULL_38_11]
MKLFITAEFQMKENYFVKPLKETDVNEEYVSWLNEPETTRYLSTVRPGTMTIASQKEYVRKILASSNDTILGLFDSKARLIGTSGIQKLNTAEVGPWIGVLIGSREYRGRGMGAAFLWIVTSMLFSHFQVSRTYAGIRVLDGVFNVASYNAFLKIGYWVDADSERKCNQGGSGRKKVIIVSCSPEDLAQPENIGITKLSVSWT